MTYRLARLLDPATSHQAAAQVNFATAHHAAIVQCLKDHGRNGLTVHEMAQHCRLDAHQLGKRTKELESAGVIHVLMIDGEDETRKTPTGRRARVWRLV